MARPLLRTRVQSCRALDEHVARREPLNVVRFTLVGFTFTCAMFGVVSACLPDLDALPDRPVDGGPFLPDPSEVPGCGDGIIATNDDGSDAGESCDPGDPDAGAIGCSSTCAISCGGVIGPSGHCYFIADSTDFAGARESCTAARAHVVTIGSEAEASLVRSLADGGPYRVGMLLDESFSVVAYRAPQVVEEPGWPLGSSCPGCFAVGAEDGGVFAELEADAGSRQSCLVAAAADGGPERWRSVTCSQADPNILTICEREPLGRRSQPCGGPLCTTLEATAGRKRYVISVSPATAQQADEFCRGYPGGSLVVLDSREEREELAREIRQLLPSTQRPTVTVWLGLAKSGEDWRWDDGLGDRPAPWANAQPSPTGRGRAFMRLDVNAFDTQLAFASENDDEPRLFVCQRPAGNDAGAP